MWQRYNCKTFKDYHDLYLTLDVTLLADVFENFRDMALREYKLDPAHSWTVPGFTWNCALKMSKIELELITDPETFLFFRKFYSRRAFHRQSSVCQSQQYLPARLRSKFAQSVSYLPRRQ